MESKKNEKTKKCREPARSLVTHDGGHLVRVGAVGTLRFRLTAYVDMDQNGKRESMVILITAFLVDMRRREMWESG